MLCRLSLSLADLLLFFFSVYPKDLTMCVSFLPLWWYGGAMVAILEDSPVT
jgi:hypothetical protein